MPNTHKLALGLLLVTAALFGWGAWALPDTVPVHWGPDLQPDRWGSKWELILMGPFLPIVGALCVFLSHRTDGDSEQNRRIIELLGIGIMLLGTVVYASILRSANGAPANLLDVYLGVGPFLAVLGNYITRAEPSKYLGFRNRYALANRNVWHASQRRLGYLLFGLGLALMSFALLPHEWVVPWLFPAAWLTLEFGGIAWIWHASRRDFMRDAGASSPTL